MAQLTVTMAFNTTNDYNRLNELQQAELVTRLTNAFGGATLTQHFGGYRMEDGTNAIEYSYTIDLYLGDDQLEPATEMLKSIGQEHNQESIIVNGEFIML